MSVPFAKLAPVETVAGLEVSEDTVAQAFVMQHANDMRFCHDSGRWYEWDGVRWKADRTARGFHYAREISRRMADGKKSMCKASVASGAERFCRADPRMAVTAEYWDADLWLLGTPGGAVNLKTGQIAAPDPDNHITKITAATPAPGVPKLWLQFLQEASGNDPDVVKFLKQWCGYCLTGDTREHALLFAYGPGGNGKSVFVNTITKLLGDYAVTAAMETFTAARGERHSTDVAMLRGARLVTASETEEGRAWAEARIKQMTGADPITARFMRMDNFTYVPQFKLTIVGNHAPQMHSVDDAMRRRFRIIPFDKKPANPDRELEDKLVEEWPQILSWMIEGCRDWLREGLTFPKAMQDATDTYFEEQDVLGQWIKDECEVGPNFYDPVAKLFDSWTKFARANGEEIGKSRGFGDLLVKRQFLRYREPGTRARCFKGLKLRHAGFDEEQGYARR